MRPLFKLEPGEVYRDQRLRKGYDKLRDAYGAQGYFQWTPLTKRVPDEARRTVDVTLTMEEDKRYYVGRITFTGNHTTRDKVLRREMFLNEADVFNTEALKLSIRRINQLGYFKPIEAPPPRAQRPRRRPHRRHVHGGGAEPQPVHVRRRRVGAGGHFRERELPDQQLPGPGRDAPLAAQRGGRSSNYQMAVTEPYLFDRPITAGLDLFSRKNDYLTDGNVLGYSQVRTGASVTTGCRCAASRACSRTTRTR